MSLNIKAKELFKKHLEGELSNSEKTVFNELLVDKDYEFLIKQMLFEHLGEFNNYPKADNVDFVRYSREFYTKIRALKEEREKSKKFSFEFKRRHILNRVLRVAAILLLTLGFSFMLYSYLNLKQDVFTDSGNSISHYVVTAPLGAKSHVLLPDGSEVWLNAGSTLKYNPSFNNTNRKLELEGEAYFDVAKNEALPLRVITSDISITALGTKFNVKAYSDENIIETTLVEGKVNIQKNSPTNSTKGILLEPNQIATYVRESNEFISETKKQGEKVNKVVEEKKMKVKKGQVLINEKINSALYTSWKDNKWLLEAEELSSLAKKLERKFNVKIIFQNESLLTYKFTGTLKDETLEQVLEAIKLTAPIEFSVDENTVTIKENKKYKKEYNKILR